MATIINNPGNDDGSSSGVVSLVIGAVLLVMIGVLFFVYVLPALSNAGRTAEPEKTNTQDEPKTIDVNVELPAANNEAETETQTQ